MPQQLLNRLRPYLLMHLIMTSFLTVLSYCLKVSLVFKKSTKETKSVLVVVQYLNVFGIDLFLNILNLPTPLNFIYPEMRITNLDKHTLLCMWAFCRQECQAIFSGDLSECRQGCQAIFSGDLSESFPYEISKSGKKISNFCVSKIGF